MPSGHAAVYPARVLPVAPLVPGTQNAARQSRGGPHDTPAAETAPAVEAHSVAWSGDWWEP